MMTWQAWWVGSLMNTEIYEKGFREKERNTKNT
jgi:hypothetical protein